MTIATWAVDPDHDQTPATGAPSLRGGEHHAPLTPLIGRQDELALLMRLLRQDDVRLVVLTGPGGIGKTRLARHIAGVAWSEFPDGVWIVPLAPIADPDLVLPTVARALGLWDGSQIAVEQRLAASLAGRRALIVLDNIEQVSAAGPQLVDLLGACPDLTLLATSRTVLHVSGEHNIVLQPLPLSPPASGDGESDAVRLFVDRARATDAAFTLTSANRADVEEICRRVDGLPLAIELAAARINHLPAASLLARLDHQLPVLTGGSHDHPNRLRTMRNAIDWSHALLTPEQQALFRRLSVFVGGASLPGIRSVALPAAGDTDTSDDDEWLAIDLIASLIDHSLVRQREGPEGEPRFGMLEPIRQFALEQLAVNGEEDDIRRRHASWCLAFARDIRATYEFRADSGWHDLLEAEHPNLRAALRWLAETGDMTGHLQLATALYPLWYYLGHSREGSETLRNGIARAQSVPPEVLLEATLVATELATEQCRHDVARELGASAEQLARSIDDRASLASALYMVGRNDHLSGSVAEGRARILEALALWEELGDRIAVAHTHTYLAMVGSGERTGRLDAEDRLVVARRCWEIELGLFRAQGNMIMTTRALHGLGYVAYLAGDRERSIAYSHEALRMRWGMGEIRVIPAQLEDIGDIARATGQYEVAVRLYGAAARLRERTDIPVPWWFEEEYASELDACRMALSSRVFDAAWSAGQALSLAEAVQEALAFSLTGNQRNEPPRANPYQLTEREIEVLRLLIEGRSNPEIAARLYISRKTVANHVGNILGKFGVDSRTAAVSHALRHNLI